MAQNIYTSESPPILVPRDVSYSQFLMKYNPDSVPADKVIFEELDNPSKKLTYGSIRKLAAFGAAGLRTRLNLQAGDYVIILGKNSVDWAHLAHSLMWIGVVCAGVNPAATPFELAHYFTITAPKAVFVDPELESGALEGLKLSKLNVPINILGDSATMQELAFPRDFLSYPSIPPFDLTNEDNHKHPGVVCFSSGTSGKPKAAVLSHHNLIAYLLGPRAMEPLVNNWTGREVFFAPFCHMFGLIGAVTLAPFQGHFISIQRTFDFHKYIEGSSKIRSTILRMVPPVAIAIVKDPFVQTLDLKSVNTVLCAGAPLQVDVVQALQKIMGGVNITQGYGLSEGSVTMLRGHLSVWKSGSVGKVFPTQQVRVVDDDLKDVKPGEQGECLVKGNTIFMGYRNNPEETKNAFTDDGWLKTGDIVRVDEDGFFWLTDRKKELIKYKGNQVPPAELEDTICMHPAVGEAACCGIWDHDQQTELPLAYVSLKGNIPPADRPRVLLEVKKFVDGKVSAYKRLRGGVHYLETIPKTPAGKILRRLLPARLEAEERAEKLKRQQAKL